MLLAANKLIEKVLDPRNAEEHYQSFLRAKNRKSIKESEIITYQPKTFEKSNITDKKSSIPEHPKTTSKLGKTIGKAEKLGFKSYLYIHTENSENF